MPKFKNFKDRKGKLDQAKNNMFVKLSREIYVEARNGGTNPDANFKLKTAIANARQINIPNDTIERAIKKAAGDGDSAAYEKIIYEGYGPGGAAIMVECLTDNRNRTAADVRSIFNKRGGNMGETGCVSYMFDQKGVMTLDRVGANPLDEDNLIMQALEAGAEDVLINEDSFEIITHPHEFEKVKTVLEQEKIEFSNAGIRWLPRSTVNAENEDAVNLLKMMEAFDDNDDVQDVYANFEVDDEA